jgi:pyruvate,water dikinase
MGNRRTADVTLRRDVRALHEIGPADAGWAGRKATTLAVLRAAGFPVPDGFVVSADALDRHAGAAGLDPDCTPGRAAALDVDEALAARILAAADRLGGGPFAVRSSGVDEDSAAASHAGQYRTILGADGGAALLRAVRSCWASRCADHVTAYREAHGLPPRGRLAVLVQRMVPADAAGVAFTTNPVTRDPDETVVNAVRGLGDRLVDGSSTPDEWTVRDSAVHRYAGDSDAVDAGQVRTIAALARRVAAHQGGPQDIEWAIAGGEVALLQARPISATQQAATGPEPVPVDPPPGHWKREASHAPLPWTPFGRALLAVRDEALRVMCADQGYLLERVDVRDIGGWEYSRLVPLGGKERRPPPQWLVPLLIRVVPTLRRRIAVCVAAYRADLPAQLINRWYDEWLPQLIGRTAALRDVEPATMAPDRLAEHFDDTVTLFEESVLIHFRLHGAIASMLGELVFTCRELFGWDDGQSVELLCGLSERSTEPARRLAALAELARERPAVRALLATAGPATGAPTAETDAVFAAAFADYQREYGFRGLRYEVADPMLAELPWLTLKLIAGQLEQGYDPVDDATQLRATRTATEEAARALLAGRPAGDAERFDRALRRARLAYPVREDNEFYTFSGPIALVRRAALAVGRQFAERRQVDRPEDVFFLEPAQVRTALRAGTDQHAVVARRRAQRAWVLAHPGPASYGPEPGPPPTFAGMPAEVVRTTEALIWYLDRIIGPPDAADRAPDASGIVRGIGASAGRYTGPARVISGEAEFDRIRAGDVLVCPITSPVWSVVFPSIGALVTDTGGTLSHPAIIAREYRIPAVVATGVATRDLRDGQLVTVDGATGVVEVVS